MFILYLQTSFYHTHLQVTTNICQFLKMVFNPVQYLHVTMSDNVKKASKSEVPSHTLINVNKTKQTNLCIMWRYDILICIQLDNKRNFLNFFWKKVKFINLVQVNQNKSSCRTWTRFLQISSQMTNYWATK